MIDNKKQWVPEEIELLLDIKKTFKEKKWKLISKSLAKKGFKRSEHECRHKWVNCLNPEINHGLWRQEELEILYRQYEENSSQWSVIQKSLPHRTQIKIKNHFYGVLRNILRFVVKYFKSAPGKQSQVSNKINPNSLQSIYKGEQEYSFMNRTIKDVIAEMGYHLDKHKLLRAVERNKSMFEQLNFQMFKEIAQNEAEAIQSDSKDSLSKGTLNCRKVKRCNIMKELQAKHKNIELQVSNNTSLSVFDERVQPTPTGFGGEYPLCFYYPSTQAYFYINPLANFFNFRSP